MNRHWVLLLLTLVSSCSIHQMHMDDQKIHVFQDTLYQYYVNLCQPIHCGSTSTHVCQLSLHGPYKRSLLHWDQIPTWIETNDSGYRSVTKTGHNVVSIYLQWSNATNVYMVRQLGENKYAITMKIFDDRLSMGLIMSMIVLTICCYLAIGFIYNTFTSQREHTIDYLPHYIKIQSYCL